MRFRREPAAGQSSGPWEQCQRQSSGPASRSSSMSAPGPRAALGQLRPSHGNVDLANLDPRVADKAKQLQGRLGTVLPINSAYRSKEYNDSLPNSAKRSQHLHGKAIDIDVSDLPREERLRIIEEASRLGFTGIGVYDNSLHLDIGGRRAWGPSRKFQSVPDWAKPTIKGHMARKYQREPA